MSYTLHVGDCREVMAGMDAESVDAVVTDPPYGIALDSNGQHFKGMRKCAGDDNTDVAKAIHQWCKMTKTTLVMFYSPWKPIPEVEWRSILVWWKRYGGIGGDWKTCWKRDIEMIGVAFNRPLNGDRDSSILDYSIVRGKESYGHFAQKPVPLMRYLIEKVTQPGDLVVDFCMGVGSTGVAAIESGRTFIGIDTDPEYVAIARARIEYEAAKHRQGELL